MQATFELDTYPCLAARGKLNELLDRGWVLMLELPVIWFVSCPATLNSHIAHKDWCCERCPKGISRHLFKVRAVDCAEIDGKGIAARMFWQRLHLNLIVRQATWKGMFVAPKKKNKSASGKDFPEQDGHAPDLDTNMVSSCWIIPLHIWSFVGHHLLPIMPFHAQSPTPKQSCVGDGPLKVLSNVVYAMLH